MRQTQQDSVKTLADEDGTIFGVNLGADYVAEHEGGIHGLKRHFDIGRDAEAGIELRTINKLPSENWKSGVFFFEGRNDAAIGLFDWMNYEVTPEQKLQGPLGAIHHITLSGQLPEDVRQKTYMGLYASHESCMRKMRNAARQAANEAGQPFDPAALKVPNKRTKAYDAWLEQWSGGFYTAWSDKDFLIIGRGEKEKAFVQELAQAMVRGDLAIGVAQGAVFRNGGISICIPSRMPQAIKDAILEEDLSEARLQKALKKTGLAADIKDIAVAMDKRGGGYRGAEVMARWSDKEAGTFQVFLASRGDFPIERGWYDPATLREKVDAQLEALTEPSLLGKICSKFGL